MHPSYRLSKRAQLPSYYRDHFQSSRKVSQNGNRVRPKNEKSNGLNFPRERIKMLKEKRTTPQKNSLKIKGFLAKGICEKTKSANPWCIIYKTPVWKDCKTSVEKWALSTWLAKAPKITASRVKLPPAKIYFLIKWM